MEKVYIQTYSVIEEYLKDFKGTLKKIADLGYAGVEFAAGYGGMTAPELKAYLEELGLDAISSHVGLDGAMNDIDFLAEIGCRYMICPGAPTGTLEDTLNTAKRLNEIGAACAKKGLKYGYHNHTQEFIQFDGKYALDILMENTDPENVVFQLDAGWASCAGIDVIDYINKHAGRIELVHAKECCQVVGVTPQLNYDELPKDEEGRPIIPEEIQKMHHDGKVANGPTGTGIFDWKQLKATADAQGTVAYIVEREYAYDDKDIFDCIKADIDYLKTV